MSIPAVEAAAQVSLLRANRQSAVDRKLVFKGLMDVFPDATDDEINQCIDKAIKLDYIYLAEGRFLKLRVK